MEIYSCMHVVKKEDGTLTYIVANIRSASNRLILAESELKNAIKSKEIKVENIRLKRDGSIEILITGDKGQIKFYKIIKNMVNTECEKLGLKVNYMKQAYNKNEVDYSINGVVGFAEMTQDRAYFQMAGWLPWEEDIYFNTAEYLNTEGIQAMREEFKQYLKELEEALLN